MILKIARRLQWLQAFTRLERWKEELLLVNEEMRRVATWYKFHIDQLSRKAKSFVSEGTCDGYLAVLHENLRNLQAEYDMLPKAVRDCIQESC